MKTLEAITAVRALLAKPDSWTQNVGARKENGEKTSAISPAATCWCLLGAIEKVTLSVGGAEGEKLFFATVTELSRAHRLLVPSVADLVHFNDTSTHGEVLQLLDRAVSVRSRDH